MRRERRREQRKPHCTEVTCICKRSLIAPLQKLIIRDLTSHIIEPDMLIFPFIMFVSSDPIEKKIKPYFYQSQPSPFFLSACFILFYFPFFPSVEQSSVFMCINCPVKCPQSHQNSPFKTIICVIMSLHYIYLNVPLLNQLIFNSQPCLKYCSRPSCSQIFILFLMITLQKALHALS